jgi:hypothetical protein
MITCGICGAKATNAFHNLRETAPVLADDGTFWRTWEAIGGPRYRCDLHYWLGYKDPERMSMNATELAMKMLEWEQAQRKADALKAEIESAVLEVGATQTVGNVRASYSGGRKSYDYRGALAGYDEVSLEPWKTEIPAATMLDYRAACKGLGVEAPYTQSEPSVTVKLLES